MLAWPWCNALRNEPDRQDVDLLLLDVVVVVFDLGQDDLLEQVEALHLPEDHLALVVRQKSAEEQVPEIELCHL